MQKEPPVTATATRPPFPVPFPFLQVPIFLASFVRSQFQRNKNCRSVDRSKKNKWALKAQDEYEEDSHLSLAIFTFCTPFHVCACVRELNNNKNQEDAFLSF